ncbi:MAG: hypothetical protein J5836_02035 [Clostridia bacterium]|nr:hypothetical protein [Clostridia bacterium]
MKRIELKKSKAALLCLQMALTVLLLITSVYLLFFVAINGLGAWMITSYIFITLSVLAIICYSVIGYKKGDVAYQLAIIPFMAAVFVNVLLPQREPFQVALLTLLFALTFGFLLRQKDRKFAYIASLLMVFISLVFSVYSSVKADVGFLGEISENWPTYVAMYLSIFVPTIMSGTVALTYSLK